MVRLGDVAAVITKGTTPTSIGYDFVNDGVNFIKIESIDETGKFIPEKFAHIDAKCHEKLKRSQLAENDILFSIAGAIGRTAIVDKSILPANTNQALAIIRIPDGIIDYSFMTYALQSPALLKQFETLKQGVAQLNLSLKNVGDFIIPDFTIDKQKCIATVLDKVSELIAMRKKQLAKLDELVKARFVEMFGDPILNTKGWKMVTIGDIVTEVKYGTSRPAVDGGKYPYLRMNNITFDGHLDLTDLKRIDIPENEVEKYVVHKGDVLFNRTNSIELVGKTCVFDKSEAMVIAGYIIRVRLNKDMLPLVLSYFMNTDSLKEKLRNMAKGAVNQANINAQELMAIEIYVPPLELQKQFSDFVEQTGKSRAAVKQVLEKAETLKKALMQKYFG